MRIVLLHFLWLAFRWGLVGLAHPTFAAAHSPAELYNSGRLTEAVTAATAQLDTAPDDSELHLVLGRALTDLEKFEEARAPLAKVPLLDPAGTWRSAWAFGYLGRVHFALGNVPAASNALARAVQLGATANATRFATNHQGILGFSTLFNAWTTLETTHFAFHFAPSLAADRHPRYAEAHERAYDHLTRFFGPIPSRRIHYFVWGPSEVRESGIRLGFAVPELGVIHTAANQTLGHELTHVISHQALRPRSKSGFINEGLAVAFDLSNRDQLALARQAVALAAATNLTLPRLWTNWSTVPAHLAYPAAGAWIQFLLRSGTREELLELATDQTAEAARRIYGNRFPRLIRDFESALHQPPASGAPLEPPLTDPPEHTPALP